MLDKTENLTDSYLEYKRLTNENDVDIPYLLQVHKAPEIARFLSIDETNYFSYVTNTANVYFYKVYQNNKLIGSTHVEKQGNILFMDILVFPEFQRTGLGTKIVKDIQNDILGHDYEKIEISIDKRNTASLKLFEKACFIEVSTDDELINYIYERRKCNW